MKSDTQLFLAFAGSLGMGRQRLFEVAMNIVATSIVNTHEGRDEALAFADQLVGQLKQKLTEHYVNDVGRFGHHPDPAIDFCEEVGVIQAALYDFEVGLDGAPTAGKLREHIDRAMTFKVGGDLQAVRAKGLLRALDTRLTELLSEKGAADVDHTTSNGV